MKLRKVMIPVIVFIVFFCLVAASEAEEFDVKSYLDNVHVRIGVAYKVQETKIWFDGVEMRNAITARIGMWYRFSGVLGDSDYIDFGIDHHSQYSEGAPFNDRGEYGKSEIFLDYTFTIGGLL